LTARAALAAATGTPPDDWSIEPDAEGRPLACGPAGIAAPAISLSHTRGLVACAVCAAPAVVGVDVEALNRKVDAMAMARRNCAPREIAELGRLDEPERTRRFIACWTLKEACVKALGIGLRVPLREIELDLSGGAAPRLRVSVELSAGKQWALRMLDAPDGYALALAVGAPALGDIEVRQRRATRAELLGHERG
jgi:4'-phosphopantetheinyl transferase